MRARLSYANVMSSLAVFVALGGSSYAAVKITGADVKDNSLTGADIRARSIAGSDIRRGAIKSLHVKDGSLRARDFRAGRLPRGPRGKAGPPGPRGATGTVDTSRFYDRAQSDARFLSSAGKASDADRLDGLDSSAFTAGGGHIVNTGGTIPETYDNAEEIRVGSFGLTLHCRETFTDYLRIFADEQMIVYGDDGSGTPVREIFVSGAAGNFTSAVDRIEVQAVYRSNPDLALTAVVTLADTGEKCEYVVQATASG